MEFKITLVFKYLLSVVYLSASTISFAAPQPEELDFIGGGYVDGEYRCFSEPCFSLHKGRALHRLISGHSKLENGFQGVVTGGLVKMLIQIYLNEQANQR